MLYYYILLSTGSVRKSTWGLYCMREWIYNFWVKIPTSTVPSSLQRKVEIMKGKYSCFYLVQKPERKKRPTPTAKQKKLFPLTNVKSWNKLCCYLTYSFLARNLCILIKLIRNFSIQNDKKFPSTSQNEMCYLVKDWNT